MSNYPNKFRIPADRIPRAWSQGPYDCCVMASFVKVLEVLYEIELSVAYAYGRHSNPNFKSFKHGGGGDYDYTANSLLTRGSVPSEMYTKMNEIPNIIFDIENHPDLAALDKEAEKTRIKSFDKIVGNGYFKENVKKYLYEYGMPLVGNMTGKHHCTVIVGWDEDGFEFCDHDGRVDPKTERCWVYGGGKFNEAYYLEGYAEEKKGDDNMLETKFADVSEDRWSYEAIMSVASKGIMVGTSTSTFEPTKPLTREEAATIIHRLLEKGGVK